MRIMLSPAHIILLLSFLYRAQSSDIQVINDVRYKKIGCFLELDVTEASKGPSMQMMARFPDSNGLAACGKICLEKKIPYVGLQDVRCFCGSEDYKRHGRAHSFECYQSCPGREGIEICGGDSVYTVYKILDIPYEEILNPAKITKLHTDNSPWWENDLRTFICIGKGNPLPSLEWRAAGDSYIEMAQAASESSKRLGVIRSNFHLRGSRELNTSPVSCSALQNFTIMDTVVKKKTVNFTPKFIHVNITYLENEPKNNTIIEAVCNVGEASPTSRSRIVWKIRTAGKKFIPLRSNGIMKQRAGKYGGKITENALKIAMTDTLHGSKIACFFNQTGRTVKIGLSPIINTFKEPKSVKLKILNGKGPILEGAPIYMICEIIEGKPPPRVEWWRRDPVTGMTTQIYLGKLVTQMTELQIISRLEITASRRYHNNIIGCFAITKRKYYGAQTLPLIIFNKPRIKIEVTGQQINTDADKDYQNQQHLYTLQTGTTASINCLPVEGFPEINYKYTWSKSGKWPSRLVRSNSKLELGKINEYHAGNYTCRVLSEAGVAQNSVLIHVQYIKVNNGMNHYVNNKPALFHVSSYPKINRYTCREKTKLLSVQMRGEYIYLRKYMHWRDILANDVSCDVEYLGQWRRYLLTSGSHKGDNMTVMTLMVVTMTFWKLFS